MHSPLVHSEALVAEEFDVTGTVSLRCVLATVAVVLWMTCVSFAQGTQANPATITSTSTGGVGFVTETSDANGIGAGIGEWGIPYTGGFDGPPQPGAEPSGP